MKKTLYKDIKECNIKLIIIIGLLFIMFSGFTSYSIFTDTVVSNNVITVKVGKKRYTLTINQTSEEILTCTNNTTGECSTSSLQVAKDESVSCSTSTDSDYTVLLLELNNDLIGEETFTYNYEENSTITPTYVKKTPEYCFTTSESSITKYNCYEGNTLGYETITDVVIPSTINGVTITKIGNYAFYSKGLTSVDIPDTVTTLGEQPFGLNNLKALKIPSSITEIDASEPPLLGATIENVIFIDEWIIIHDKLFYGAKITGNLVILDGVTRIGVFAFGSCGLTSVEIPDGVTTIETRAFSGNNLTSVIIPESVTSIRDNAFYANALTSVKIKGKSSSSDFTYYSPGWGWADGYSDSNIIWNYTE